MAVRSFLTLCYVFSYSSVLCVFIFSGYFLATYLISQHRLIIVACELSIMCGVGLRVLFCSLHHIQIAVTILITRSTHQLSFCNIIIVPKLVKMVSEIFACVPSVS